MMRSYYNELDTHCCRILANHIGRSLPAGMLDAERSIADIQPGEVADYRECHFFAGIGGFPLGFKKAGLSGVNVWTGGFPCQDLSVAGNRAGLAGERSGLWFEFYRLLAAARPHWVVIENVPGLLSSNKGRDFAVILRGLVELGYGVCWRVLDAQYFGVPQRRRRVFIVGHLGDGRAAQVLFESESGAWNPPPSRETRARIARPLANGSTTDHYDESQQTYVVGQCHGNNVGPMGHLRAGNGGLTGGVPFVAFQSKASAHNSMNPGEIVPALSVGKAGGSCIAFDRTRGTSSGEISAPLRACGGRSEGVNDAKADAQCVAFQPRYVRNGRGAPSEIAAPLTAEAGRTGKGDSAQCVAFDTYNQSVGSVTQSLRNPNGTFGDALPAALTQYGVRRLTPTECERLQGFDDGWTAGQSDTQRYKQLGNAVAVPVIEWVGRRIMQVEQLALI